MKKIVIIIIALLFLPLNVKGTQKTCVYDTSKSNYVKKVEVYLECDTMCKIVGGIVQVPSAINNIGYISVEGKFFSESLSETEYTTFDCPSQIGLTHPPSAGVAIIKPYNCDGTLEYGCFQLKKSDETGELQPSDKYKNITACRDTTYEYIKECACMPAALTDLTSRIYSLIKIAAPALLLIVGGFDLIKAMSAQDEKAIGKARQKLVKKFIAAAAVFLIFTVVQFLVSTLAGGSENTLKCVDYILNGYKA